MQVIPCIVLYFILGASGETDGCFDDTSLLQRSLTSSWGLSQLFSWRHDGTNDTLECPCIMGEWEDWGDCDKTCGGGDRTRTRPVKKKATNGSKCDDTETQRCNPDDCPHDCVPTEWSQWGDCTETCNPPGKANATRTRTRGIKTPAMHGGSEAKCQPLKQTGKCDFLEPCPPTPCEWKNWEDWGDCDKTCGGGTRERSRDMKKEATYGGEKCNNTHGTQTDPCNTEHCPIDCKLGPWSKWGDCQGECPCSDKNGCGNGTQTRKRIVIQEPLYGGKKCDPLSEQQDCDTEKPCPEPCKWGKWTDWSSCSASCATGEITRSREKLVEEKYGGKCNGTNKETLNCTKPDCPFDCVYSWEDWDSCSKTCGGGIRKRVINVITEPSHGGEPCPPSPQTEDCNTSPECDCQWGPWEDWSACSETCGEGTKTHYRKAISEAKYGLEKCEKKDSEETVPCKDIPFCPEDCEVGPWGDWSECHCGPDESQSRSRSITKHPKHGGEPCPKLTQPRNCSYTPCPIPCKCTKWSDWTDCDTSCGGGERTRERTCTEAKYGGKDCPSSHTTDKKECDPYIECPIDCEMGPWSDWSPCPRTCDGGQQERTRRVKTEAAYGGKKCDPATETKDCGTEPCPCCYHEWSEWACVTVPGTQRARTREVDDQWKEENEISHRCNETKETQKYDCNDPNPGPGPTVKPEETPTVCAIVKDAADNTIVPQAKVTVSKEDLSNPTDASGKTDPCFDHLTENDEVVFTATKDGYVSDSKTYTVTAEGDQQVVLYVNKILPAGEWRIILTWGMTPLDLDSKTYLGGSTSTSCDVWYNQRSATCPKNQIGGKLDLDHCFYTENGKYTCNKAYAPGGPSEQAKPETTTLKDVDPDKCGDSCKIVFHVSNYMVCKKYGTCEGGHYPDKDTGTIEDSKAEVQVIHGDKQVAFFELAKGDGEIRYKSYGDPYTEWWVFAIDLKAANGPKVIDCKDTECPGP